MRLLKILDYICFFSAIIYTLVPAIFLYILQLKLFNEDSLSILGILFMYSILFYPHVTQKKYK